VQAAEALGAGSYRIIRRHVVPNIISPIIVKMSMDIGYAILAVAALGFIGIGVKPPAPEWGSLIARRPMPVTCPLSARSSASRWPQTSSSISLSF